jgi:hypothetical protein
MAMRNSEELGVNLSKVALRLVKNQKLCKYIMYTDDNPLDNPDFKDPVREVLHKNIKIVPQVNVDKNTTRSTVIITYDSAPVNESNTEFDNVNLVIMVYTPMREWQLNDINLRPFLIISEIEKSLKDKTVEGVGKLKYHGWATKVLTDTFSCYHMMFTINAFD